jgi:hypothetical protein
MLFLSQPIQSFLDLGVCKEYMSMAKPRGPKKSNGDAAVEAPTIAAATASPETMVAEPNKSIRKPSIVKSDRANLFPINVDEEIRRLAYLLSERRGFEPGHETEDWLAAEREVQQRYRQHSA